MRKVLRGCGHALAALALGAALAACGGQTTDSSSASGSTLNVIAGSELKDLEPYFDRIAKATGVRIVPTYSGTLAGIDRIRGGEAFDAAWFANDRYLLLGDTAHRVKAQERIMLSPVVVGVKASIAKSFGWTPTGVTWKAIGEKSDSGAFRFAMTNPASSNSGFSAVIAVASALAGASDVLKVSDVNAARLRAFFRGQALTAGSSGWLIDAYVHDEGRLDGVINYESSLLALNRSGRLHEQLVLLYPKEGIVTADYPLVLLDESKRPLFDKVVAYLKSDDFQSTLARETFRRPVVAGVAVPSELPKTVINEVAFPNSLAAVDGILLRYLNENRVPAHSFYVIDTSGSMQGDRIDGVRSALGALAGDDPSLTGRFARFQDREKITLISFSSDVTDPVDLTMQSADDPKTLSAVRNYATGLRAGGNTAIYCALEKALATAGADRAADGLRYRSIVLMTDGENNECDSESDFEEKYAALPRELKVKIFPILFGEGNVKELQALADVTGGKLFDSKNESLSDVFKEIRGYQ
jgi:Ca-activated chloride channel family protein